MANVEVAVELSTPLASLNVTDTTAVTLPTELLEYIVDYLSSNQSALVACSLAARVLLRATRVHLFRNFHIRADDICGDRSSGDRSAADSRFSLLLRPTLPCLLDIARFVRHLTISTCPTSVGYICKPSTGDAMILAFLRRFVMVEAVRLRWLVRHPIPAVLCTALTSRDCFPSLKTLRWEGGVVDGPSVLLDAICTHAQLQSVDIQGVDVSIGMGWNLDLARSKMICAEARSKPIRIQELSLRNTYPPAFFSCLTGMLCSGDLLAPVTLPLRRLAFDCSSGPGCGWDAVNNLVSVAGQHLEELELNLLGTFLPDRSTASPLDLSGNPSLTHLRIGPVRLSHLENLDYAWLYALLRSIHAPALRQLALTFAVMNAESMDDLDWDAVDGVLARIAAEVHAQSDLVVTFHVENVAVLRDGVYFLVPCYLLEEAMMAKLVETKTRAEKVQLVGVSPRSRWTPWALIPPDVCVQDVIECR